MLLPDAFKKATVFIRSGSSDPIVTDFQDVLKIPSVIMVMGFGLPDDNLLAPNKKFHIPNFHNGIETICRFFETLGEQCLAAALACLIEGGLCLGICLQLFFHRFL